MDQDSFGDTYPYATHDDLSSTDNSEGNDISLQWKRNAELLCLCGQILYKTHRP